jgi:hypothetical protein
MFLHEYRLVKSYGEMSCFSVSHSNHHPLSSPLPFPFVFASLSLPVKSQGFSLWTIFPGYCPLSDWIPSRNCQCSPHRLNSCLTAEKVGLHTEAAQLWHWQGHTAKFLNLHYAMFLSESRETREIVAPCKGYISSLNHYLGLFLISLDKK